MQVLHTSDICFISSRRQCNAIIQALLPPASVHAPCEGELAAIQHLTPELGVHAAALRDEQTVVRRKDILSIIHDSAWKLLVQQADCAGQARLRAVSATGADAWLRMTPGLVHDSMLGNVAFRDVVGLRLGLCLFPGASTCAFCHQNLDEMGYHVLSCMGQGHKQTMLHTLRNTIFTLAQQAGATPQLEPQGLLPESAELRPADVLIHTSPSIRASSWQKFPKLALDFAIVSPFAVSTLRESASQPFSAASRYADRKRTTHDIANKCAKQLIGFEPMVWESTGGVHEESEVIVDSLCQMRDARFGLRVGSSKNQIRARISMDLQRGFHFACCLQRANAGPQPDE